MNGGRIHEEFESFYSENYPRLYRVTLGWTGDVQLAEDISHEVMLALLVRWGKYDYPHLLMFRLARQRIWQAYTKTPRTGSLESNLERVENVLERTNGQRMVGDEQHVELMKLVARLPGRQRDVVVLTVVIDLSDEQAAEILGISKSSVKTHRRRGLGTLRKALLTSTGPTGE